MYLVGAPHPNQVAVRRILQGLAARQERLVTNAEVYQEVLHRFRSINRMEVVPHAFKVLSKLVDEVYPIEIETVLTASELVVQYPALSARDAIHLSVMTLKGIESIVSFDSGFDLVPGIQRLS
ncbi:MAG: type II toxin-antitoxin system VapC family toxin [Armatimonadetes bacterium]|nr:type II toxin-antitoxin system VapC family toxin [Armatimonadota bacterium]